MFMEREWGSYGDYVNKVRKDANPRSETDRNEDRVEDLTFDSEENPSVPIVECWIKRDVLGTGDPQEFCVFYDSETKQIIYYEYVAKLTPDNKVPYSTVSIG